MTKPLIGICGAKGSGKSQAASYLVMNSYYRLSMATVMKNMLITMGIDYRYIFTDKEEIIPELGCTGRHLLQTLGTEWGRDTIHKNIWVMAMAKHLKDYRKPVVIDDIRFANEVQMIRDLGGKIVYIQRDSAEAVTDQHSSEQLYKTVVADRVIRNNGSLSEFQDKIPSIVCNASVKLM